MDEFISKKAAINAVKWGITYARAINTCTGETKELFKVSNHALNEAVERLKELPSAQPEQQWIPCSEKYPDQDERVIVTIGGYDYFVWDCMSNRGDDYFWEDEHGFYHNKYEVLAWMPLPEPYQEGD